MNNLKEKIEKALDKCDVVVVSGVSGVGKSTLLKKTYTLFESDL